MTSGNEPASPCVSVCALDSDDLCVGCLRSGSEIAKWGEMTASQKLVVLKKVAQREAVSLNTINIQVS